MISFCLNRIVKRVPLDFDWPLNKTWFGYLMNFCPANEYGDNYEKTNCCKYCRDVAVKLGYRIDSDTCPDFPSIIPPDGEGYQCWETTSEGSPVSPVFKTFDKLCKWLADNPCGIIHNNFTKEDWTEALKDNCPMIDMHTNKLVK